MTRTDSTVPFHLVDVFAEQRYYGNQLAVVDHADDLTDEQMQRIAAEFGFSETTFVLRRTSEPQVFDVRIFTPEEEIPFAGHPTLGTAYVLRETFETDPPSELRLDLGVGEIPVTVDSNEHTATYWMRQAEPKFMHRFQVDTVATVLGLAADDIDDEWPIEAVTTGLPTVIVPVDSRAALERIAIDRPAYDEFVTGHQARNVLAFSPDPRSDHNDVAVRVFAPYYGVPEDPATGSSNGCLAAYLAHHRYFCDESVDLRVEQGYELARPSRLRVRATCSETVSNVEVGGDVVPVAQGELVI